MTLITRITMNPASPTVRHVLASTQRIHAVVAAITDGSTRPLWRLDGDRLTIVSDTFDTDRALARLDHPAITGGDYTGLNHLDGHGRYRFIIEANPVSTHDGHSTPLREPGRQIDWLRHRLARNGATADSVSILTDRVDRFRHGQHTVTLHRTRFVGILTVTDMDRLRMALRLGVGKGRAYGCGLLLLAPAA